jgi:LEA14-like dessication related protein
MKSLPRLTSCVFCLTSLFISACAPLKPLEFRSLSDFQVHHLTSSPELSMNLNLHNPNSVGGKVKDFHLDFFLGEIPLASIQLQNVRMPSRSDFTLPLTTNASYGELIKFLPSGIGSFNSGKQIPVKLNGSVTIQKFIFKKTLPFEFHDSINTRDIKLN